MRDLAQVWAVFQLAQQTSSPPSQLVGLQPGSLEAFCFDQAIMHGGASITQTLEEVPMRKGKNAGKLRQHAAARRILARWL